jgi:hypothetical protein
LSNDTLARLYKVTPLNDHREFATVRVDLLEAAKAEIESLESKLDEQVRLREMAESFLRTAIEINEKNTSRLDSERKVAQGAVDDAEHYRDVWGECSRLLHDIKRDLEMRASLSRTPGVVELSATLWNRLAIITESAVERQNPKSNT